MSGSLWVDDSKPAPHGFAVARTYDDALRLLRRYDYDTLYLDHDLGDHHHPERTGYDLLLQLIADGRVPAHVECISWNPVGKKRIEDALANRHAAPVHRAVEDRGCLNPATCNYASRGWCPNCEPPASFRSTGDNKHPVYDDT